MSTTAHRLLFLICSGILAAGCTTTPSPPCATGSQRMVSDHLYFGTAKPGGVVSPEEWASFLERSVTPAFPNGLSVWPSSGQWKGADGAIVHEDSYVLQLIHPDDAPSEAAIRAAMAEYKSRFQQEAVMRVKGNACVSF